MKWLSLFLAATTALFLLSSCATGTPRTQVEMEDTGPSTTYVDNDVSNPGLDTASKMISPVVREK